MTTRETSLELFSTTVLYLPSLSKLDTFLTNHKGHDLVGQRYNLHSQPSVVCSCMSCGEIVGVVPGAVVSVN